MSTAFIISSVSFFVCLILLFYFISKYREAEVKDDTEDLDLSDEVSVSVSATQDSAKRIFGKTSGVSAREIADLKEQLKDLHYRLEEMKLLEEKRNTELTKLVNKVEQRVSTFENEYVNKLQPTLYSLISELENIQGGKAQS